MHFAPNEIYHLYNRGNNKQRIFFSEKNYKFLLRKIDKEWKKYCDIICYCLMPNHFHFILIPNKEACETVELKGMPSHLQNLSSTIGKTLSSYTRAINLQNDTTGNLFQKKTKAKCLTNNSDLQPAGSNSDYLFTCFNYIHQNPVKANLVSRMVDWPYSSFGEYSYLNNYGIINQKLGLEILQLTNSYFANNEIIQYNDEQIDALF
jgi:putative transposase